jgi:hypothetical protein
VAARLLEHFVVGAAWRRISARTGHALEPSSWPANLPRSHSAGAGRVGPSSILFRIVNSRLSERWPAARAPPVESWSLFNAVDRRGQRGRLEIHRSRVAGHRLIPPKWAAWKLGLRVLVCVCVKFHFFSQ